MKAWRWWKRLPVLARRMLIAAVAILALTVFLGLVVGGPLRFVPLASAWLLMMVLAWVHYRSGSKIEDWERRKREAEALEALKREALESKAFEREVAELESKPHRG